jgi:hypothetical protein
MTGDNYRSKIGMTMSRHTVVMHGIAQLAFFGNNGALSSRFGYAGYYFVLVSINGPLPCCKTNQQNPGANNMALISVHCQIPYGMFL